VGHFQMSNPNLEELYRKMSDAWVADNWACSLEISRDLLRQFPEFEMGWLLQGILLRELARYDEAEKSLRRAVQLLPDQRLDLGYVELGHLFKARGDYENAEPNYRKSIELAPEKAGRHVYLGALLAMKGDFVAAEKAHRDGTRCAMGDIAEAYLNLGYVLRCQERYNEALDCFNKAIEISPEYELALSAKHDMEKVLELFADQG
jgi:tetratricopeptide (TPR) repeat protein